MLVLIVKLLQRIMKLKILYSQFIILLLVKVAFSVEINNIEHVKSIQDLKLELVQVHFRHGERTPLKGEYIEYPYLNESSYEPYGFGQLTNTGKKQMYDVGCMLRKRYHDFLGEKYNSDDVYAYSSDMDRTKMSLQLVLAGLYPPSQGFVWNPDLKWAPLPFRYTPKKLDILLQSRTSSRFKKLIQEVYVSEKYKTEMAQCVDVFDLIRNLTGKPVEINLPEIFLAINNLLHINEEMNLKLPEWYTNDVKKNMSACLAVILSAESYTTEMKRINGGTMIRTFLENMNVNETFINPRKIYIYSGHDVTLISFLRSLNICTFPTPDFGLTLIFEKFRDYKDNLYIKLLAYNPLNDKLTTLKIGRCSQVCPMSDYIEFTRNITATDMEMRYLINDFNHTELQDLFFNDDSVRQKK